jgi:tRNA (cytidine/uridine-2'-O-)-methyltransferase
MDQLHVVLVEPEIPQNAGNVARTCAAAGARLHLVKPLGFFVRDRHVRRAGLEYWDEAGVTYHDSLTDFLGKHPAGLAALFSRRAGRAYDRLEWAEGSDLFLVFGKESRGLPEDVLASNPDRCFRIPMIPGVRSLNLASTVAVVVYDLLRRRGFPGLA